MDRKKNTIISIAWSVRNVSIFNEISLQRSIGALHYEKFVMPSRHNCDVIKAQALACPLHFFTIFTVIKETIQ